MIAAHLYTLPSWLVSNKFLVYVNKGIFISVSLKTNIKAAFYEKRNSKFLCELRRIVAALGKCFCLVVVVVVVRSICNKYFNKPHFDFWFELTRKQHSSYYVNDDRQQITFLHFVN